MLRMTDSSSRSAEDATVQPMRSARFLYSENRSHVARSASKKFYPLDQRTGLPVAPHKCGFFRVSKSDSHYSNFTIEYRVGNRFFSFQKDRIFIESRWGGDNEMISDDVLNSALFLMERNDRRKRIDESHAEESNASNRLADWAGDYPKKNIHSVSNLRK